MRGDFHGYFVYKLDLRASKAFCLQIPTFMVDRGFLAIFGC